ncbi:serine hydrolase domain-containing protein [Amycolatopsis samaneae]|uniref:Serine hydrolase domain-containing protein n=1 Tax=Amycolatopsis samaneae TaxID=664691 RepID=A0ABW5GBD9_9PSEU
MSKRTLTCAVAVLAAAAFTVSVPAAAQAADDHAGTRALLDRALRNAPGAAVFAGNAAGSWSLRSGTGDTQAAKPIQPDEHHRIASQTKTFTAVVTLQLADEGKVALDTPIETYLPGVVDGNGYDGTRITVRQLLQHHTGIPVNNNPRPRQNPDGSYTLREVVREGLTLKPSSAPGTRFEYSNTNFEILGLLIEKVTGKTVGEAITERIITPLGLRATSYPRGGDRTLPAPYVHGYAGGRVGPIFFWVDNTTNLEPSMFGPAGAVVSTMSDVTAFYRALAEGKLVSPAGLAEMRRTIPWEGAPAGYDYGLGLLKHTLSCGGDAWGHPGNVLGYATWTAATDDGRYATVVTNTMNAAPGTTGDDLRFEILDAAMCGR